MIVAATRRGASVAACVRFAGHRESKTISRGSRRRVQINRAEKKDYNYVTIKGSGGGELSLRKVRRKERKKRKVN